MGKTPRQGTDWSRVKEYKQKMQFLQTERRFAGMEIIIVHKVTSEPQIFINCL